MVTVAPRDIKAGEEILIDYGVYRSEGDSESEKFLQNVCDAWEGLIPVEMHDVEV